MSIFERFPERASHVRRLQALLAPDGPCVANLVVWGRPQNGKASIVKAVLEEMGSPHVWITCCATDSVESVISTVIKALRPEKQKGAVPRRLLRPTRFLQFLPELCSKEGPLHRLVLENPEFLSSSSLLQLLMKVEVDPEIHLALVFLAQSPTDWMSEGSRASLVSIAFDGYSVEEMISIMERHLLPFNDHDKISQDFIRSVVSTLMRCTTDVLVLKSCLSYLFKKFWESAPAHSAKLNVPELNRRIVPYVSSVLKRLNQGNVSDLDGALREMEGRKNGSSTIDAGLHSTGLPVYSKILLLAGFICSHNRPEHDHVLFDASQITKRRRLTPVPNDEKKRVTPVAFDFERHFMLAQRLMQEVDTMEDLSAMCSSLFASQFATLEAFSFIKRVSGDPVKRARYVCSVDREFATKLAEGLKLNLPDYLDT